MKRIVFLITAFLGLAMVNAQNVDFPLMFSQYGMNGTSAFIGKGGAIGALGGDIMSASYNPAGLGLYRSSEFTFSMGLDMNSTKSTYNGLVSKDSHPYFNYGNLGLVLDFNNGKKSSWKHVQLSFGLNRLMNFNNRVKISRKNLSRSYIDANYINYYDANGDGVLDNGFETSDVVKDDFFQSGVIGLDDEGNLYSEYFNGSFDQIIAYRESGYLNEFTMSISGNYSNWLYLGATLGIPFGDYTAKYMFSEQVTNANGVGKYNYNTEQDLSITGFNLKLGAIVKPVSFWRIGGAIHTPTFYSVDDDFYQEVSFDYTSGGWFNPITYRMQSPWRFIAGTAFVLGNNKSPISGTISLDYEYADYSFMSFDMDNDISTETNLNSEIENTLSGASNIRLGGEIKLDRLYIRAGYAYYGSPYESKDNNDLSWNYVTCGVGYKGKVCNFDLAYAYGKQKRKYYVYDEYDSGSQTWQADSSPSETTRTKHLIQATIGFKF
ncbi:MAG: hypothetical protein Q4Q06_03170 [Bacteroidota bacterium]|nr:hypothetical protein [Bacteroidota bacterium]